MNILCWQANLVLSLSDHNGDLLPPTAKFLIYVHCADSHFHLGEYRKAESLYKKSLQFRKFLLKSKSTTKSNNQESYKDLLSDIDIKYQIHVCLMKTKNQLEALQILQSIPGKQRTAKVHWYFINYDPLFTRKLTMTLWANRKLLSSSRSKKL